jgi:hypothetical protein
VVAAAKSRSGRGCAIWKIVGRGRVFEGGRDNVGTSSGLLNELIWKTGASVEDLLILDASQ